MTFALLAGTIGGYVMGVLTMVVLQASGRPL